MIGSGQGAAAATLYNRDQGGSGASVAVCDSLWAVCGSAAAAALKLECSMPHWRPTRCSKKYQLLSAPEHTRNHAARQAFVRGTGDDLSGWKLEKVSILVQDPIRGDDLLAHA